MSLPELHGLVLAGGRSSRMGRDKAEIAWGPRPQWRAVADLLRPVCAQVWWSCTQAQRTAWGVGEAGILDHAPDLGPAGGLHAAFTRVPDAAWMVVGCDYPDLGEHDVRALAAAREPAAEAIAFTAPSGGELDPMLSIWEPPAQRAFLRLFAAGERSPRRILGSVHLRTISPRDPATLIDRNTPAVSARPPLREPSLPRASPPGRPPDRAPH